jgi:hypothetical protein
MMGYRTVMAPEFEVQAGKVINHELVLTPEATTVGTISIAARKPFIEQSADKTVVNVEGSLISSGLTALDVLKRVPGAQVSASGEIRLKGQNGVLVFLNGRAMYLETEQLASFLKTLPADQIERIEVLTNPPAQYDARGRGGVIDIKLKQGQYDGLNGSANLNLQHGVYPKAGAGLNLSYRKRKLSLTTAYQYNYRKNLMRYDLSRTFTPTAQPETGQLISFVDEATPEHQNNLLVGGSYQLSARTRLDLEANLNFTRGAATGTNNSRLTDVSNQPQLLLKSSNTTNSQTFNSLLSGSFRHDFDTSGTRLAVQAELTTLNKQDNQTVRTDYLTPQLLPAQPAGSIRLTIPSVLQQVGAKADFMTRRLRWVNLETGVKWLTITTDNNNQTVSTERNISTAAANHFVYTEHVLAGYTQINKAWKKWKLVAGLRLENTSTRGQQLSQDSTFVRNYTNLFPSISLTYIQSENTEFNMKYGRKIDRPDYTSVNPFIYFSDRFNGYAGNPFLLPQYSDNLEVTASFLQGALSLTANYTHTAQPLADVYVVNPQTLVTLYTKRNLVSNQTAGLSIGVYLPLTPWYTITGFVYGYHSRFEGDLGFGNAQVSQWAGMANTTQTLTLPKGFSMELSGDAISRTAYYLMVYRPVWQVGLAVQKKLWGERASIRLGITDMFWAYRWRGNGFVGTTGIQDDFRWDNRVVSIAFTYHFGRRFRLEGAAEAPTIKSIHTGRGR